MCLCWNLEYFMWLLNIHVAWNELKCYAVITDDDNCRSKIACKIIIIKKLLPAAEITELVTAIVLCFEMGGLVCVVYLKICCCRSKTWSNLIWSYFYVSRDHRVEMKGKHAKAVFFLLFAGDLGSKDSSAKVSHNCFAGTHRWLRLVLKAPKTCQQQERNNPGKTKQASLPV